jgi:hypothetical protein
MKVRIIFECTGCGSISHRPSTKWTFKDNFLGKLGIRPQRCYRCRRRFYLFRPTLVDAMLRALAAPIVAVAPPQPEIARAAKAGAGAWSAPADLSAAPIQTDVVWRSFAKADRGERRS